MLTKWIVTFRDFQSFTPSVTISFLEPGRLLSASLQLIIILAAKLYVDAALGSQSIYLYLGHDCIVSKMRIVCTMRRDRTEGSRKLTEVR